ncbi:unnamed protein product, partial [Symbiodinium microadriaticum]
PCHKHLGPSRPLLASQDEVKLVDDASRFEAVAKMEQVDTQKVENSLSQFVEEILAESDGAFIKMILLECTELPHYAARLRRVRMEWQLTAASQPSEAVRVGLRQFQHKVQDFKNFIGSDNVDRHADVVHRVWAAEAYGVRLTSRHETSRQVAVEKNCSWHEDCHFETNGCGQMLFTEVAGRGILDQADLDKVR